MYHDNKEKVSDVHGEFCDVGALWLETEAEVEGGVSSFALLDTWSASSSSISILGESVLLSLIQSLYADVLSLVSLSTGDDFDDFSLSLPVLPLSAVLLAASSSRLTFLHLALLFLNQTWN